MIAAAPCARIYLQRLSPLCLLIAASVPGSAQTKDPGDTQVYHFYHAARGVTWILPPEAPPTSLSGAPLRTVAGAGDRVCVRVINPHPGLYRYSLKTSVDSSKVEYLPKEATQLATLLQTVLPADDSDADVARGAARTFRLERDELDLPVVTPDPVANFANQLQTLAEEIKWVQQEVARSDRPGTLRNEGGVFRVEAAPEQEFQWVQRKIDELSTRPGHFGSTSLVADLDSLYNSAAANASRDARYGVGGVLTPTTQVTLNALRVHGRNLLTARNALSDVYGQSPDVLLCDEVGKGRATTLEVHVQARDTAKEELRKRQRAHDTVPLFRLRADTRFPRNPVELIPIGFMHYSAGAREYALENDTLRVHGENTTGFRVGGMLLVNAYQFGREREFTVGPGLGFGVGGEGKLLSDYLAALLLSFRDVLRIGVGAGYSVLESRLISGAQVGQPRPANAKDIGEILEDRREPSTFLIFSLAGLKLPVPLP